MYIRRYGVENVKLVAPSWKEGSHLNQMKIRKRVEQEGYLFANNDDDERE